MSETFREFFQRRNITKTNPVPRFPGHSDELPHDVLSRLAGTLADWADEIAMRSTSMMEDQGRLTEIRQNALEMAIHCSRPIGEGHAEITERAAKFAEFLMGKTLE